MRNLILVLLGWTASVVLWALFNGSQVAPCLGLAGSPAQVDCVARWEVAHQPTSPLLDSALPWLWLGVWLAGCVLILAVSRALRYRRGRRAT